MNLFEKDFSKLSSARILALVFGRPKVGKTRCVLELAKNGHFVVMLSIDRGARQELHRNSKLYEGQVALAEVHGLGQIRKGTREAAELVKKLMKQGIPAGKIWVVVDTVSHMQIQLLQEARKIDQKNPSSKDLTDEDFLRDFTTQVDWGINLTLMGEQADILMSLPCNVVYIALEKTEKPKGQPEKPVPAISGQSLQKFTGDADLILHMVSDDENRWFETSYRGGGGDRTGLLADREPADLLHVYNKIYGAQEGAEEATETNHESE